MKHQAPLSTLLLALTFTILSPLDLPAENWPSWRGDLTGSGETQESNLPTKWSADKNITWRIDLPDKGNSTPIIWDDKIFVNQAIEGKSFRGLFCFSKKDGSLLWKKGVTYEQKEKTHKANPYCSASPSTDGERVIVSYGSAGLYCYDLDGKELWKRNFGPIDHIWGSASSPVIYKNLCIYYHGPDKNNGALIALDKKSGETIWEYKEPTWKPINRTDGFKGRDEGGVIGSWSTPIIVPNQSGDQLVMSFPTQLKSFDPKLGKELWTSAGLNPLVYTSPLFSKDTLIAMGGFKGTSIAVNIKEERTTRLWQKIRDHGGIGTGVTKDSVIYTQDSSGKVYCRELKSGKTLWEQKLPGKAQTWGSLLINDDQIYTLSQSGETVIFKASPKAYQQIAHNKIHEKTNSSIAVSDGQLFIRSWEGLWCIGK